MEDQDVNDENVESEEESTEEDTGTEESSTEDASTEEDSPKRGNRAQDRIRELVAKEKAASQELEKLRGTVAERDTELSKLVDLISEKEEDSRLVGKIRELYNTSPEMKTYIEKLDKAIRGELEDVEEEEPEKPTKGKPQVTDTKAVEKLIQARTEALSQEQLDLRAELLLDKSERLIDRFMGQLPEEYGDEDRRILSSAIMQQIDWDGIEDTPKQIEKLVHAGVQKAIDWYGSPKGLSGKDNDGKEPSKKVPTAAERLQKLKSKDFGKLKAVETKAGKRFQPELSDDDFQQALAESLRLAREAGD